MPKETMATLKLRIQKLEEELNMQRERTTEAMEKIYDMQNHADNEFSNSPYRKQLEQEVETYKQYKELYEDASSKRGQEHDQNVELLQQIQKIKSERDTAWSEIASLQIEKGTLEIELKQLRTTSVNDYKNKIHKLINERNELLQQIHELRKEKGVRVHNERGAGRKATISFTVRKNILNDRELGMTIKELATKYKCSVGTVHKLIHEN